MRKIDFVTGHEIIPPITSKFVEFRILYKSESFMNLLLRHQVVAACLYGISRYHLTVIDGVKHFFIFLFTHWAVAFYAAFSASFQGALVSPLFSSIQFRLFLLTCTYMPTHSPFPYETGKLIHTSQDCSEDEISLGRPNLDPKCICHYYFF